MQVLSPAFLLTSLALASTASPQTAVQRKPPQAGGPAGTIQSVDGDSPLALLETFTGNVDVCVDVVAIAFGQGSSGTFSVGGMPAGATVRRAWLLVTSFDPTPGQPVVATFDSNDLGPKLADVEDAGLGSLSNPVHCSLYRFDVTTFVTGNGAYPYTASGHSNNFGDALVVVYEHPSLAPKTIAIHDGAEGLQESTTSTTFSGMPAADGELILFTQADNAGGEESVTLNGVTIAGPGDVFSANQGPTASLVTLPVTAVAGANTLEVATTTDFLGLHLAVLCVEGSSECFLVIGGGQGGDAFDAGGYTWTTQLSDIYASYPVLMDDIPSFPIPGPEALAAPRRRGRFVRDAVVPVGTLYAQVLMHNPEFFPEHPEQWTHGLEVTLWSNGQVTSSPFGDRNGMSVWAETRVGAAGERTFRLPFHIDALGN